MLELRPYQSEAIESVYKYFEKKSGNPLIVCPTGTGKAFIMASFIERAISDYADTRILVVTHVKELIAQNFQELIRLWPSAPAGIYSAGLRKRDTQSQILFCGIQSVAKRAYDIQKCDLMLIDECHLVSRNADASYKKFIAEMTKINPMLKVIGLTATPYRTDSGMLHKGPDRLFTDIAYECYLDDMIKQGYLAELVSAKTSTTLNVAGVGTRGGDYIAGQLELAVDIDAVTRAAVAELVQHGAGRKAWLAFCVGVKHAEHVRDAIREHGVTCEMITGSTPAAERDRLIAAFKRGEIRALTNANVLTTGFNVPAVDLIAMLRPTKSTGLYVQICGRGSRLAPGKSNCLVLDFAGNIARHGPLDKVRVRSQPKNGADDAKNGMPLKTCPECQAKVPINARKCWSCDYEWPPNIETRASNLAILSKHIEPVWVNVTDMKFARHVGNSGVPSLKVEYKCGLLIHSLWVCLEHTGFARGEAVKWWHKHMGTADAPRDVDTALQCVNSGVNKPKRIQVAQDGRYQRVVGYEF